MSISKKKIGDAGDVFKTTRTLFVMARKAMVFEELCPTIIGVNIDGRSSDGSVVVADGE